MYDQRDDEDAVERERQLIRELQDARTDARSYRASFYIVLVAGAALPIYFEWNYPRRFVSSDAPWWEVIGGIVALFVANLMFISFAVLAFHDFLYRRFERRERLPRPNRWQIFRRWRGD